MITFTLPQILISKADLTVITLPYESFACFNMTVNVQSKTFSFITAVLHFNEVYCC